jgi:hypothetical protein
MNWTKNTGGFLMNKVGLTGKDEDTFGNALKGMVVAYPSLVVCSVEVAFNILKSPFSAVALLIKKLGN